MIMSLETLHWGYLIWRGTQVVEFICVWGHSLTCIIADVEIELYDSASSVKRAPSALVMLRLEVALSVIFNPRIDPKLKQIEGILGTISLDKLKRISPVWIRLFTSLNVFASLAQRVAQVRCIWDHYNTEIWLMVTFSAWLTSPSCCRSSDFCDQSKSTSTFYFGCFYEGFNYQILTDQDERDEKISGWAVACATCTNTSSTPVPYRE